MFWFVFSLLSLLFAYLGSENNAFIKIKNVQLLSRILLIITLSYVTGFSGENFQDHQGYVNYYNSINNREITNDNINFNIFGARDYGMEFGYSILNKFCYLLGFSHVGFFFFISLLTNTFLVLFIFRFKFFVFNIYRCDTVRYFERLTVFSIKIFMDYAAFFLSGIYYNLYKVSKVNYMRHRYSKFFFAIVFDSTSANCYEKRTNPQPIKSFHFSSPFAVLMDFISITRI